MSEIGAVLKQLMQQRERLQSEIAQLDKAIVALQQVRGSKRENPARARGTRTMSAAARKRIADAQKARWEKFRSAKAGRRRNAA
jgi:hypothetical protein